MRKILFFFVFLLLLCLTAQAHQPRIVSEELIQIQNPEISQAFYGSLDGSPEYFQIRSDIPFKLYVQILVPDVKNVGKDVSIDVMKNSEVLFLLNGTQHEWTYFYEEFGGDYYFEGPQKEIDVSAGVYDFKVFSTDNQGKYVLVVGKKEVFPLNEWANVIVTMPKLKKFFDKSPFTAFFNLIGLFTIVPLLIIVGVIILLIWLLLKYYRKKPKKKKQ